MAIGNVNKKSIDNNAIIGKTDKLDKKESATGNQEILETGNSEKLAAIIDAASTNPLKGMGKEVRDAANLNVRAEETDESK